MTNLADILLDLQDTDATATALDNVARRTPRDEIVEVNRDAVARHRTAIERRLQATLNPRHVDVIEYHLLPRDSDRCPALGVARSLAFFQEILTAVVVAVRSRRGAGEPPAETLAELSALTFGSDQRGAAFVTLSLHNERLLLIKSDVEAALDIVFEMFRVEEASRLRQIATEIGVEPVAALWTWAENSVQYGFGASLRWRKAGEEDRSVTIPAYEAWLLKSVIEQTEDETVEEVKIEARVVGMDDVTGEFRLSTSGGEIGGRVATLFFRGSEIRLRGLYRAILTRTSIVSYATGEERVTWTLRELSPVERATGGA